MTGVHWSLQRKLNRSLQRKCVDFSTLCWILSQYVGANEACLILIKMRDVNSWGPDFGTSGPADCSL
jgi:hypothetical protein